MDCRLCNVQDIEGEIETCHLGDMRRLSIRIGLACFSLLFVATSHGEGGEQTIDLAVTTALEYDDNVFLVSDPGRQRASDVVLRVAPVLGVRLPHRDHSFSLGLDADYRKGTDTDIEDLNFTGTAGIELNLRNGLQLSLSDAYTQTSFDQELQEETGTPDYDRNVLRVGASYVPVDRLRVAASYEQERQDFDEGGGVSASDRDTEGLEASIMIPLTRSIVGTVSYTSREQTSPQRPDRDYTDDAYSVAARWQGPSRFVFWLEVGEQAIDFAFPDQSDFDDTTARVGTEIKITEFINGEVSIGQGVFGETVYDGGLDYRNDTDRTVSLTFDHRTSPSFSFVFQSRVVETNRVDLSVSDRLAERFTLTLGAGYQSQESVLDPEQRDDQVWTGRLNIDYPVQEWLRLGFSYQYGWRTSSLESFDFTDNRFGIFGRFSR